MESRDCDNVQEFTESCCPPYIGESLESSTCKTQCPWSSSCAIMQIKDTVSWYWDGRCWVKSFFLSACPAPVQWTLPYTFLDLIICALHLRAGEFLAVFNARCFVHLVKYVFFFTCLNYICIVWGWASVGCGVGMSMGRSGYVGRVQTGVDELECVGWGGVRWVRSGRVRGVGGVGMGKKLTLKKLSYEN